MFINLHHYGPKGHKLIADELFRIIKVYDYVIENEISEKINRIEEVFLKN